MERIKGGICDLCARIDEIISDEDFDSKSADILSKVTKTLESLQGDVSTIQSIDVFVAFGKWLERQRKVDASITEELIKYINSLQNQYVEERLSHGK